MPLPTVTTNKLLDAIGDVSGSISAITIMKSDLDAAGTIASDTAHTESMATVIASQVLINKSAISDALSAITVAASQVLISQSEISDIVAAAGQAGTIYSDTTKIESWTLINKSWISDVYSDSTIIASQVLIVKSDTSDILSAVTKVLSDTTKIDTNASDCLSSLVIARSQVLISQSEISDILARVTIAQSQVLISQSEISDILAAAGKTGTIYSDTTYLTSICGVIEGAASDAYSSCAKIYSDTTIIASQVLINKSAVSDTLSQCVVIASDAAIIETATKRAGLPTAKGGTIADNALTNNTQAAGNTIATATGGDILIEQIVLMKDGTLFAGPTGIEVTTDNVYGLTGVGAPVCANVTGGLAANATLLGTAMGVAALKQFVLESTKKLYIAGDDGVGTSAGNIKYCIYGRALTSGAYLA